MRAARLALTGDRIVRQLRGVAARLTGDCDLQKDLLQEMFLHLVQAEVERPGHTPSWYITGCQFRARAYLRRGRSVDSIKRQKNLVPSGQYILNAADPIDFRSELITRDIVDRLVPQLTAIQQQILFFLIHDFGVCEIAGKLQISHPAVIKHRKIIARILSALLLDTGGVNTP